MSKKDKPKNKPKDIPEVFSGSIDEWLDALTERQTFLYKNTPRCRECSSTQVQITSHNNPAEWRCRLCKHRFEYEPMVSEN